MSAGEAIDCDFSHFFAPAAQAECTIFGNLTISVLHFKIVLERRLGLTYEKRYCSWLGYFERSEAAGRA